MWLTQPTLNQVPNYDATNSYTFKFMYLGAESTTKNILSIREDRPDSKPIYEKEQISMDKNHILSPGTLNNGNTYLAKVRVIINNQTGEQSEWSPEIRFTCYDTPVIRFDTIDQKQFIYTNDVLMSALYSQKQNEPVEHYQFTLYDQRHVILQRYPERVPTAASPTRFSERVSDLEKGKLYYIGLKVQTKHDIIYEKLQEFTAQYISPSISGVVQPRMNKSDGQIVVDLFLKQLLGTSARAYVPKRDNSAPTHYTYWKDDYVVVPKENPLMFTNLAMAKARGWIAKIWLMNVQNGVFLDFAPKESKGNHIKFVKYDDYITCEKVFGNVKYVTRSNKIPGLKLRPFFMFIRVHAYRVEIVIQPDMTYAGDDGDSGGKQQNELSEYPNVTESTQALIDAQNAKMTAALNQLHATHNAEWQKYATQVEALITSARAGIYSHNELRDRIQEIDNRYWKYFNEVEMVNYWKEIKRVNDENEAAYKAYREEYIYRVYEVLYNIQHGSMTLADGRDKLNSYNTVYGMILREIIDFNTPRMTFENFAKNYNKYLDDYGIIDSPRL